MSINSHIQIPKSVLNYFRDFTQSDKKVWYLDMTTGQILRKAAGKLGTSKGYYSNEMETYLNKSVETPISQLNHKIDEFCTENIQSISVSSNDEIIMKNYIKCAVSRSNLIHRTFCKNSITAPFFRDQNNHDIVVDYSMNTQGPIDAFLQYFTMNVLVNKSNRPLVVPRNCFYFTQSLGSCCLVAPVSPKGALILIPKDYCQKYVDGQSLIHAEICNPDDIETLNRQALDCEYLYNKSFVASNSRDELEPLAKHLTSKRTQLEELRDNPL